MTKPRGRPFQKGAASANPCGRPLGSKNRTTLAAELLLDGEAEAITRKAIELAKAGDLTAMRLCFDHIFPLRRGRRICIDLQPVDIVENGPRVLAAIVAAAAAAELTLEDAADLSKLVEGVIKCKEMARRLMPLKIEEMSREQIEQVILANPSLAETDPEKETEYFPEEDHSITVPGDQKARSPRSPTSATYPAPCDSN